MSNKTLEKVVENAEGLLFYAPNKLFGHLMYFEGHGVYDPDHGLVDVEPGLTEVHNKALDLAYIKGLDEECEIGQHGYFYVTGDPPTVTTFTGMLVSDSLSIRGKKVTFYRAGKTFAGTLDGEYLQFKRTA